MQEKKLNFENSLEYQFLYNDDADSIFLLLSWLENRYIGESLVPKYTVTKALLTGLRRSIRGRKDKKSIVEAVNKLVGDDINRLELAFTIKAYRNAITYNKLIDRLEVLALKKYEPMQLKDKKILFHYSEDREILKFKENVKEKLIKSKVLSENEYHTYYFMDKYVKKKFFRVNFYMDKQIVVDYPNSEIMTLEGKNLTIKELQYFYSKAKFYVNRALQEAYYNQFWNSLNDQVLGRYQ